MLVRLYCGALQGVYAYTVELEVDFSRAGMPAFVMVGLAEGAVREAQERVRAAIRTVGFKLPSARITVNLAPADKKKTGTAYDLPLAMALLYTSELIKPIFSLEEFFFVAELSLNGDLRPVSGILPLAILARSLGVKGMVVAEENAAEAAIVEGLPVYTVRNLSDAVAFVCGQKDLETVKYVQEKKDETFFHAFTKDFSEVKGQEQAKRAIEIAIAGGHNILFVGSPGSGKTMLATRIPTVLPTLSFEEALEVTAIYSVSNELTEKGLITERPFQAPHYTSSKVALVGGGSQPKPGAVSLAHRGVLFLDELLEFSRATLEVLRQPLEDGNVTIARAANTLTYPAACMLVAAMNPCPCGFYGDSKRSCTCSPHAVERYQSKLSGPLLDRIDLHIEVPSVAYQDFHSNAPSKSSSEIRVAVERARNIQRDRYQNLHFNINAELSGSTLEKFCALGNAEYDFFERTVENLALSARSFTRILRIARTIADLEGVENIEIKHLAEAIQCRVLDRTRI